MHLTWRGLGPLLTLLAALTQAQAADISLKNETENSVIAITGEIVPGDAEKLVALVIAAAKDSATAVPRRLELDSGGGSVQEAAKIAALVERIRVSTAVRGEGYGSAKKAGICASACFLIWLAGQERYASGYFLPSGDHALADRAFALAQKVNGMVGLHRPFVDLKEHSSRGMTESQALQRNAMKGVRAYLEDRNVASQLIEKMMDRTSRNIYWLRPEEVNALSMSPEYEELLAANCGFRKTIVNDDSSRQELEAFLHEQSSSVQDQLSTCSRRLSDRLRAKELPSLLADLKRGVRP